MDTVENKVENKEAGEKTWGEWANGWIQAAKDLANAALGDENYKRVGTVAAAAGVVQTTKGVVEGDIGESIFGGALTAGGIGLRVFGHYLFPETEITLTPPAANVKPEDEAKVAEELGISVHELAQYKDLHTAKASEIAKKIKLDYCDLLARSQKGQLGNKDRIRFQILQQLAAMEINAAKEEVEKS